MIWLNSEVLDVADIGFLTSAYVFESVKAKITTGGGTKTWHDLPGSSISRSPYVQNGVAVDFGSYDIAPGGEQILYVEANNPRVLYSDSVNSSKASFEFTPTWFDSSYAGSTMDVLNVTLYFPPNELDGSQLKYHSKPSPWYVPESGALYEKLTPFEYLQMVAQLQKMPEGTVPEKIEELLDLFQMTANGAQRMASFSKGMKQRIVIAAALIHNPSVIF
jgi:hypothetical protein